MEETESLRAIHPVWIHRATLSLAKGPGMADDLKPQLESFFELLLQGLELDDPACLDSILTLWAQSLTETDLRTGQSSLSALLRELLLQTSLVCREVLPGPEAFALQSALLPAFTHAFEKAAYFESEVRVEYVSNRLKEAQSALERLDRSKSDFISVAAHELRTPLTLIEGYSTMLRDIHDHKGTDTFEVDLLNGISSGTRRLKAIIDDMIDVSLIDNNLLQLNFQPVWLNRLLDMLRSELEAATRERGQNLHIHDFPGSREMIFADPERLMQVLRNMLSNAIKYTPDGGSITIDGRKLPGFIETVISDTGIGIHPEDQNIIFDKFTRLGNIALHSSGKTKFKGGGPGLGLHIARGIIEAHGGAIWVESPGYNEQTNPGSTFHILLPVNSTPPDTRLARFFPAKPQANHPDEVHSQ